jgi:phage repressor protein C with HTH and peptisase S24 domain
MKTSFSSIIDRIKQAKSLRFDNEVADLLGFSRKALTARKRSKNIPEDKLRVFCSRESINYDWLLTGRGEQFLRAEWKIQDSTQSTEMERVDLWNVRLGVENKSPLQFSPEGSEPYLVIKKEVWLKFRGPIRAFRVEGVVSSPFANNEDIIMVACGEKEVQGQHLYAIRTHHSLSVNRVDKNQNMLLLAPIKTGGSIECFNLDEDPDPLVGRVIGIIKSCSQ